MDEEKKTIAGEVCEIVAEIEKKEPEVAQAILLSIRHIGGTYKDKYDKGKEIIDTKKMLYNKEHGDF